MAAELDNLFRISILTSTQELLDMSDWLPGECDGFGMAPLHRIRQQGPQQHGSSDCGFRLEQRTLRFSGTVRGESPQEFFSRRDELLRIFRPSDEPLVLQLLLPNGDLRRIDCHLESGLSFNIRERKGLVQKAEIVLSAPDTTFYDPQVKELVWIYGENWPEEQTVTYAGSWRALPQIIIDGPLVNPRITAVHSGVYIQLDASIGIGEQVTIDTRYGQVPALSSTGANLSGKISAGTDLPGFFLDPAPAGEYNRFSVSGTGGTAGVTKVALKWLDRYIGV